MTGMRLVWLLLMMVGGVSGPVRVDRPDVVLLLTDQQRFDAMGLAGSPGFETPAIDALAREGVWFSHAFVATPQCSPTRASLLTGRYPHRTGVMGNVAEGQLVPKGMSAPLEASIPSLGTIFRSAGYQTAYFGKWHLGGDPNRHGFEVRETRPQHEDLTQRVLEFLTQRKDQRERRPLLLVVSWINPHEIYGIEDRHDFGDLTRVVLPESRADDLTGKPRPQRVYRDEDQGRPFRRANDETWRQYARLYQRLTRQVDAEIGNVIARLRSENPATLIIFSSDHGDLGGAHGLPFKGPAMYEELVRVPLIVSWPPRIKPNVVDALVSSIDVLPTLCDLSGIAIPNGMDGCSLRPLLEATDPAKVAWRDAIFVEYFGKQAWRVPIRMIRTRTWKYVRYLHDGEELYDLERDPHEVVNLADSAEHMDIRRALSECLDRWMKQTDDPFPRLGVTDRQGRSLEND